MSSSKDLFLLMREQEIATSNFLPTKKEIEFSSKKFATELLENGEIDKYELFAQAERATLAITNIRDTVKESLPKEKTEFYGIEINPVNGRQMIQFSEDEVWQSLNNKLKEREELLKVALKTNEPFYDNEGCEIPKVSVKYSKDSLTVKY